jgi:hypothetical protein
MPSFGKPRTASGLKRKSRGFVELKRSLIVCEGSKTEPYYFKSLIQWLGLRATSVLVIGKECESAPISVYEYADTMYREDSSFDEVFCVFDRDRHPSFDRACAAISQHSSKVFHAVVSNPCFEYWLLLHFRYTRAPFVAQGVNSPGDMVLKAVRDAWPEYTKDRQDVFSQLNRDGNLQEAIVRARRARADANATGELNPSTSVDVLVDRLQQLASTQLQASFR